MENTLVGEILFLTKRKGALLITVEIPEVNFNMNTRPYRSYDQFGDRNPAIEMIGCPLQPGNLRISKRACALKHIRARKKGGKNFGTRGGLGRPDSFIICRTCTLGRIHAEELKNNLSNFSCS